jgi:hypothetical protein
MKKSVRCTDFCIGKYRIIVKGGGGAHQTRIRRMRCAGKRKKLAQKAALKEALRASKPRYEHDSKRREKWLKKQPQATKSDALPVNIMREREKSPQMEIK